MFGNQFDRSRQQDPFRLLHDAALQRFGRIVRKNLHSLLQQDLTAVRDLIDEVDGRAGDLDAACKRRLVDVQTERRFNGL